MKNKPKFNNTPNNHLRMAYDFIDSQDMFPTNIESYSDNETAKVQWMKINELNKILSFDWAFNHNRRIEMALDYFKKNYGK